MNTEEGNEAQAAQIDGRGSAAPFAEWATLNRFEVMVQSSTKVTANIYANFRQQMPIEVLIDARNAAGEQVTLSVDQMRAIKLINYNSGSEIPYYSYLHNPKYIYDWTPTREDGSEAVRPAPVPDDESGLNVQTIMLYLQRPSTDLGVQWIAAEIVSPSGAVYRTNTPNAAPGTGKFDSWVKANAVERKFHHFNAFKLSGPNYYDHDPFWYDIDLYYLSFKNEGGTNYRIVDNYPLEGDFDVPYYSWKKDPHQRKYQTAFRPGPEREVHHPGCGFIKINSRYGEATAARVASYTSPALPEYDRDPRIIYFDQYGNSGMVRYLNSSNGNTMSIADAGLPPFSVDEDYLKEFQAACSLGWRQRDAWYCRQRDAW